jgi:rhodanese-related sulfurtransferase
MPVIPMSFIVQPLNLALIAAALVSGGMLVFIELAKRGGANGLSVLEATQMINSRNAVVIDVRDAEEFNQGSVTGARNIPLAQLTERKAEWQKYKTRPVILLCQSGARSSKALAQLTAEGLTEVYNLTGGIAGWREASMPVVKAAGTTVKKERQ